ncbi:CHAT domain-containing protein [Streptomyces xiangluensis]|uniref:CHAT domain-containing protein n=1 Tax=Streptomyces xiangluensis TaxID=2665720 RepID=A0ABV8YVL4_9ACTN
MIAYLGMTEEQDHDKVHRHAEDALTEFDSPTFDTSNEAVETGLKTWGRCLVYALLGDIFREDGQREQALEFAQMAATLARQLDEPLMQSLALRQIAQLTDNMETASSYAEKALSAAIKAKNMREVILDHDLLAEFYLGLRDLPKARHHAEEELLTARRISSPSDEYDALILLAKLSLAANSPDQADEYANRAFGISGYSPDDLRESQALIILGQTSWRTGHWREAHTRINRARRISESSRDSMGCGTAHLLLSELERANHELKSASDHANQALSYAEDSRDLVGQGNAHQVIGELLSHENLQRQQAIHHAQRALHFATVTGNSVGEGNAHLLLGRLYLDSEDPDRAKNHAQIALDLATQSEDTIGQSNARALIGEILYSSGAVADAKKLLEKALEQGEETGNIFVSLGAHWILSKVLAEGETPQWSAALRHAVEAIKMREIWRMRLGAASVRSQVLSSSEELTEWALRLAKKSGDGWTALEISEAARAEALTELLAQYSQGEIELPPQARRIISEIEDAHVAANMADAESSTAVLNNASSSQTSSPENSINSRIESLYRQLGDLVGNAFGDTLAAPPVSVEVLRGKLPRDTHTLLISAYPGWWKDPYFPFFTVWVPPDGREPVIEEGELTKEQVDWLSNLTNARGGDYSQGSLLLMDSSHPWRTKLSERLLPSGLRRELNATDIDAGHVPPELLVIPSGELWGLPFAALDVDGEYLIKKAALSLAPSVRLLGPPHPDNYRGFDNRPAKPSGIIYLHEDATPFPSIDKLAKSYNLQEVDDPVRLREELRQSGSKYKMALLVVHGDNQQGLKHGLRLRDHPVERLSAAQLLGYQLPPYLVLGACWSGWQSFAFGEEPIGLPTVALTRGARYVTAALYPVGIDTTATILRDYVLEISSGAPPSRALRNAQLNFAGNEERNPTPWHWAGFTTITASNQDELAMSAARGRR